MISMNDAKLADLEAFKAASTPNQRNRLWQFKEEIIDLHFSGYSLKLTHKYLVWRGVACSYVSFTRWVKENIDFNKYKDNLPELVPPFPGHSSFLNSSNKLSKS